MRHQRATFADDTFERLEEIKGDRSWRQAIKQEFGVTEE